ncbi:MAG TPA: aminopeptidase, partial [Burkholderiales bacterium]|nr:aminopeptidase [Burkholderiales bacterium]
IGGVVAYSTLGWFDDPLLSTMLTRPEPELAGLLFHELAHQKIYVRDDTAFNESFATAVEREGVRRWLAAQNAQTQYATYIERAQRREEFMALMLVYRVRLEELYVSDFSDDDKRSAKNGLFNALRHDYAQLKKRWDGYAGFDGWMENLNNAKLLSIGLYHDHIAAFESLLALNGGDLTAFYRTVTDLTHRPRAERDAALATLTANPPGASTTSHVGTQQ